MRGTGSGRWRFHERRVLVDECLMLRVRTFGRTFGSPRSGATGTTTWGVEPTAWRALWRVGDSADGGRTVILVYTLAGETISDKLALTPAVMPADSVRWYFVCPACRRRVTAPYRPQIFAGHPGRYRFRCRRCHNLAYESQLDRPSTSAVIARVRSLPPPGTGPIPPLRGRRRRSGPS